MAKTIQGSCHCGAISYQATLDLAAPTVRCNCSICSKSRAWLAIVHSNNFELTKGENLLNAYQFGPHKITHMSCKNCGVRTFGHFGKLVDDGDVAVSVATLALSPDQFADLPVVYLNGAEDDFQNPPKTTSYL